MIRLLLPAFLAACFALCILADTGAPATALAQDEAGEDSDTPYNANMTWDEAEADLRLVIEEDDEEAYQRINAGRLQWVPLLMDAQYRSACTHWAHDLMLGDLETIRRLQEWETLLADTRPDELVEFYEAHTGTFRDPDAQLCRAIIALDGMSAAKERDAMVKRKPDNVWVRAALAWLGRLESPEACIDAMLEILPRYFEHARYTFDLAPALLDEEGSEYRAFSREFYDRELELYLTIEGVWILRTFPAAWASGRFFERLGVFVDNVGSNELRDRVDLKLDGISDDYPEVNELRKSFLHACVHDSELERVFGPVAQNSAGPRMLSYARKLSDEFDYARLICAVSVLHGSPDWVRGQGYLLEQLQSYGDAHAMRVGMRMMLARRDDRLDAIVNVARNLAGNPALKQEREGFRKALEASGVELLAQTAKAMSGTSEFPPAFRWEPLGLKLPTRVELTNALAADEERAALGTPEAVYWMDRARADWSHQDAHGGFENALRAIRSDGEANGYKDGVATITQTVWGLLPVVPLTRLESVIASCKQDFPKATELLENQRAVIFDATGEDIDKPQWSVLAAERAWIGQHELTEEQIKTLQEDPRIAGARGQFLLGVHYSDNGEMRKRNELLESAHRAGPMEYQLLEDLMQSGEEYARYPFGNWLALERYTVRAALVGPLHYGTIARLAAVHARANMPPRGIGALTVLAWSHPAVPYHLGRVIYGWGRLLFVRDQVAITLTRALTTHGDAIFNGWDGAPRIVMGLTRFGRSVETNIQFICSFTRGKYFAATCLEREMRGSNAENVNHLLNMAMYTVGTDPEYSLQLVEKSEEIGVSPYGHFVGSQTYIRAKAQLGEWDEAIKRYREMRDTDVGYPPYLDWFLLHGMAVANDWEHLDTALEEIKKRESDLESSHARFALRRAFMAAGKYGAVSKVPDPGGEDRFFDAYNQAPWSGIFHEARALLEDGNPVELARRANGYYDDRIDQTIGMALDTALLFAICLKVSPQLADPSPDEEGRLHVLSDHTPHYFLHTDGVLDQQAMLILSGELAPDALPEPGKDWIWHGARYAERPQVRYGSGFITPGEVEARDRYVRGVIAWLTGDDDEARRYFKECVELNQRFSHEYHIAEWVLGKFLKPKED